MEYRERPDWDEFVLKHILPGATVRADCRRRQVAAILMLKDHSIVMMGYNGSRPGGPSCLAGECPRGLLSKDELPSNSSYSSGPGTCHALHAEWNVFLRASWQQLTGSTLYISEEPCYICRVMIEGSPLERAVWPTGEWKMGKVT